MNLTQNQDIAVTKLFSKYITNTKKIFFKAPTGSGKTFMIANLVSKIISYHKTNSKQKICVLIATISTSDLPYQFVNKLNEYNAYLETKLDVSLKDSPSKNTYKNSDIELNFLPENKKVLVVGKSSFTKASLYITLNKFEEFIQEVKTQNYKFIYIRDEAHIGIGKSVQIDKHFESQIQDIADFAVFMSATPPRNKEVVEIKEEDIEDGGLNGGKYLLKTKEYINPAISLFHEKITNSQLLDEAILKFKLVKRNYKALNLNINPAMLIQVKSKPQEIKSLDIRKKYEQEIAMIVNKLKENNLYYVIYFGDYKESNLKTEISLKEISQAHSPIDVIIFKVGPATGWDIPRACMLVQLRDINSYTLNTQTIGRIRRNPLPDLSKHNTTDSYFIYSNVKLSTPEQAFYHMTNEYRNQQQINKQWQKFLIGEIKSKKLEANIKENFQNWFCNLFFDEFNQLDKYINEEVVSYKLPSSDKEIPILNVNIDKLQDSVTKGSVPRIEPIKNAFQLKQYVDQLENKHLNIFKIVKHQLEKYCIKHNIHLVWAKYFIFQRWWEHQDKRFNIRHNYMKFSNSRLQSDHLVRNNKYGSLPKEFVVWKRKIVGCDYAKIKNHYPYENFDIKNANIQYLDSEAEKKFFQQMVNKINLLAKNKHQEIEIIFTRNPSQRSDIYFEYIAEKSGDNQILKAYFDFIIRTKDKFVYIEVKSDENNTNGPINSHQFSENYKGKIQDLVSAMKKYKPQHNLILAIWKPEYKTNLWILSSQEKLENISWYQHENIVSLDDILTWIVHQ